MAKVAQVGVKVLRTEDKKPSKIQRVEKFMGRTKPVTDEQVIALADSLRTRGQEQPLQVRAIEGSDEVETVFGNTRGRAGLLIETGYKDVNGKDIPANPDFRLRCEIVECSDEDAFVNNLIEQAHRNHCSPVDDAKNHQRLRDEHEMSDAAITKLYGYGHQSSVTHLKKLLDLPEAIQEKIHDKMMSKQAGLTLASAKDVCEAGAFDAVMALVKNEGGDDHSIGNSEITAAIKEWRTAQKAPAEAEAGSETADGETTEGDADAAEAEAEATEEQATPMTFKQLKDAFAGTIESERTPPQTKKCVEILLSVMKGEKELKNWAAWIMKQFGEKLLPAAPKTEEIPAPEATPEPEAAPAKKGKKK